MQRKAIVNCAVEQGFYLPLQERVLAACKQFGGDAELFFGGYPDGCPSHLTHQYVFKVRAMEQAIQQGFRRILWVDCRCRPIKSFQPIWDCIEQTGYYVGQQGDATLGQWCSDTALALFGISRETANEIILLRGGVFGLNLDEPEGWEIWRSYKALCDLGAFTGAHQNQPGAPITEWGGGKLKGHVSNDPAVGGHRHDESALSFALWNLGLKPSRDWTNIDIPDVSLIERNV